MIALRGELIVPSQTIQLNKEYINAQTYITS